MGTSAWPAPTRVAGGASTDAATPYTRVKDVRYAALPRDAPSSQLVVVFVKYKYVYGLVHVTTVCITKKTGNLGILLSAPYVVQ